MSEMELDKKYSERKEIRKKMALAVEDSTGQCLSLNRAGAIVQTCLPKRDN
jgi:hypothetical protein